MEAKKDSKREVYTNPELASRIVTTLYRTGAARSSDLVERISLSTSMSDASVLAAIAELVEAKFVERNETSRKNVQYVLSTRGRQVVEEEMAKNRNMLIESIEQSPYAFEISIEALARVAASRMSNSPPGTEFAEFVRGRLQELVNGEIEAYKKYNELLKETV